MRKGGRCFEVRLGGVTHSVTVDRSAMLLGSTDRSASNERTNDLLCGRTTTNLCWLPELASLQGGTGRTAGPTLSAAAYTLGTPKTRLDEEPISRFELLSVGVEEEE